MNATLFLPLQAPHNVSADGLIMPDAKSGFAQISEQVATLLGCESGLVDVQASAPHYVAYSVFNYEGGPPNKSAMEVLAELTGYPFDPDDEDSVLLGPVLVVMT